MRPLERRIKRLEQRQILWHPPSEVLSPMERARRAGFALAKATQPDATAEQRRRGRKIARLLRKYPVTPTEHPTMPEPVIDVEPALPKHAYVTIEEGEMERSGTHAWLAMAGREVLKTFHGLEARQAARGWVGTKYGANPAKETEVPLSTIEEEHGYTN